MEYKCPCCGGKVEFDSTTQKMKCPFCDSEFDVQAMLSMDDALANAEPDSMQWEGTQDAWHEGETEGMRVYTCNSCGGEIIGDSTTAASQCPYCGNPVVMSGQFSGELRPDLVIPFKLDKEAAKTALKQYVATKKLVPKIFKSENHIDEIKGVYVPFWLFSGDAEADITYKGQKVRAWSDSAFNYTETSVFGIHRNGVIAFDSLPVDGSSKMADDLMESLEPFDVSQAVPFQTAYLAGYLADKYDVAAEDCIERANARVRKSTEEAFISTVEGYTGLQAESTSIRVTKGTRKYALYPVWLLNTSWNGQKYLFAMNGQTGKLVGDLPMDKGGFWKWVGLLTAGIGAAAYALLYFLM